MRPPVGLDCPVLPSRAWQPVSIRTIRSGDSLRAARPAGPDFILASHAHLLIAPHRLSRKIDGFSQRLFHSPMAAPARIVQIEARAAFRAFLPPGSLPEGSLWRVSKGTTALEDGNVLDLSPLPRGGPNDARHFARPVFGDPHRLLPGELPVPWPAACSSCWLPSLYADPAQERRLRSKRPLFHCRASSDDPSCRA